MRPEARAEQQSGKKCTMSEPVIAAKQPAVLELEPGTYWWCACGQSQNQPWCDGSHKGSEFQPKEVVIEEAKRYALCQCKHGHNGAFCDGSHRQL
jgi:CDGSH-type Zn-finger protein